MFLLLFLGDFQGGEPENESEGEVLWTDGGFTLPVDWKKISYALKSFKHIFRNYWAHYTKETIRSINVRNAGQCNHLPFGLSKIFVVYLLQWVGFWVTCTNNVCDVCQHFCLKHHWKFINTLCNIIFLNYRTMKKKPQLLHKLLMRTTVSCNFCSKVVRVKKFVKYVIRDNC